MKLDGRQSRTQAIVVLTIVILTIARNVCARKYHHVHRHHQWENIEYSAISCRGHSASLTEFGGVGDGTTSNTKAFQEAINHLSQFEADGGALLYVPPGKWLTGSFNLTSHFTLYLDQDAVLLASKVRLNFIQYVPLLSYLDIVYILVYEIVIRTIEFVYEI
ncbi:hypothetical protein Leryth_014840 [Lithospermum erythrorhizon]|nr:hypothetical protein Leryth_014840 [Lithospermum erythrorhizon]